LRAQSTPEDIETAHLEHLDALASRAEEARLLALLKMPPPASHAIKLEDAPAAQPRVRKRPAELARWDDALTDARREETGYVCEWQQFCGEVPLKAFEEGRVEWVRAARRKRRREERLEEKREERRRAKRVRLLQGSSDGTQGDLGRQDEDGNVDMAMVAGVVADQDVHMNLDETDEDDNNENSTDDDREQNHADEDDEDDSDESDDDDDDDDESDTPIGYQTQPLIPSPRLSGPIRLSHSSSHDSPKEAEVEAEADVETNPDPDNHDQAGTSPDFRADVSEPESEPDSEPSLDADAEPAQSLDPADYALPAYLSQGIGSIGYDGSDDEYMG